MHHEMNESRFLFLAKETKPLLLILDPTSNSDTTTELNSIERYFRKKNLYISQFVHHRHHHHHHIYSRSIHLFIRFSTIFFVRCCSIIPLYNYDDEQKKIKEYSMLIDLFFHYYTILPYYY